MCIDAHRTREGISINRCTSQGSKNLNPFFCESRKAEKQKG